MIENSRLKASHEAYISWSGDLRTGEGRFELGSGAVSGSIDYESRFASGFGATPEELLGAAHAACFTMRLADILQEEGLIVHAIHTNVEVLMRTANGRGTTLECLKLHTRGDVRDIDREHFHECAETARRTCALAGSLSKDTVRLDSGLLGTDPEDFL